MSEKYFTKYPRFIYDGKDSRNITRRALIRNADAKNPYNFYPFLLKDELRSDQVADFYYNDPELDWFIYHMNNIIDPYYDWYNDTETIESLIRIKYGSIENSMKKVWVYKNNWATAEETISPYTYDEQIPPSWKKYYNPDWGAKADIISYSRKQDERTTNTNRIIQYDISYVGNTHFQLGELVDLKYEGEIVGGGEVEYVNTGIIYVKNVFGNTIANSSVVISVLGETSTANATANAVTQIVENIPLSEDRFWSPVYYYEYEVEKNEERKHIQLIDNGLSGIIITEFEKEINSE